MRARYFFLTFPIFGGLLLAFVYAGYAQQSAPAQRARQPINATQQKKGLLSLFQDLPPMPEEQQQFCDAFQALGAWHKAYEARVNAAGNNPIQLALIQKETPDFDRLFGAREFAVIGDGTFQNWSGHLILMVDHGKAYAAIQFPCAWTSYNDSAFTLRGNPVGNALYQQRRENLYLGNGFNSTMLDTEIFRQGVPIDSPAGKAMAALSQGEAVTITGKLTCTLASGFKKGGCETANPVQPDMLLATISSITSAKTGKDGHAIVRLTDDPPMTGDFDRVNALRKERITFSLADHKDALQQKAKALVWKDTNAASIDLMEFVFSPERCSGCVPANTFVGIDLDGYDLDPSGKIGLRRRACSPEKAQNAFCIDDIVAFTESDMPAVRSAGPISSTSYLPGPNGLCYLVHQEDQAAILHRTDKINGLLQPLGLRLESGAAPTAKLNACDSLNNKVKGDVDTRDMSRKNREAAFKAVSVTVAAGEFGDRLKEAVKTRALSLGANPAQYDNAIRAVDDIVRLCSYVTEAEFAESISRFNQLPQLGSYKNGKYRDCIAVSIYRAIPEPRDQPGLLIRHDLSEGWDPTQKRWGAVKFHIDVFLKPVPGRPTTSQTDPLAAQNEAEALLIAMSADIPNSTGSAAADKFVCPGARLQQNFTGARNVQVSITAPTKVTRFVAGGSGQVIVDLEGFPGSYTIPESTVKDSCPGFVPLTSSSPIATAGFSTQPVQNQANAHNLKLTPAAPLAEGDATIVAPGRGNQNYNIYYIDTQDFTAGGVLDIEIQIDRNSATDGSFDLFPSNAPIPTGSTPTGTLVGRYDVRPGLITNLVYRFRIGQVFILGLEGNWFSPQGATGRVHFKVTVRR
jgi:hypothetical protein